MSKNLKRGEMILGFLFLLFVTYSCSTPEERAIKVPEPDSTATHFMPAHPAGPDLHVIEIKDMKFQPENLSVKRGDTVMWINRDMVTHCVTEAKKKAWTSSNIAPGASWKMIVKTNADYFCAIHQVMKGKITVK